MVDVNSLALSLFTSPLLSLLATWRVSVAWIEQMPSEVVVYQCDVTKKEQVDAAFDAVRKRFGRLDGLVNNAGETQHAAPTRIHMS